MFTPKAALTWHVAEWLRSPHSYRDQRVEQIHAHLLARGWRALSIAHVRTACEELAQEGAIVHKRADCYAVTSAQLARQPPSQAMWC